MIDLRPHFKQLHWRPMPHSMGVPVASDFADYPVDDPIFGLYKRCGLWTIQEARILQQASTVSPGLWLDIGCHTGWTSANIAASGNRVIAVDPMLSVEPFLRRFEENTRSCGFDVRPFAGTSREYFAAADRGPFQGVCIDGDHEPGLPVEDAKNALASLAESGVILFHDAIGKPVQDAVMFLVRQGFAAKVYLTPHVVAFCWRGDFDPPKYNPEANVAISVCRYLEEIEQFV